MFIRPAKEKDIPEILKIYEGARGFMRESGNPNQWAGSYPARCHIEADINEGASYVCVDGEEIVACFYFKADAADPTYVNIYEGQWQNDKPYGVIHRVAVKYFGRRIVDFCFSECFKLIPNIKIDTHRDNIPMQKCLTRNGFKYCGIIYLESGDERLAFQKCK